MIQSKFSINEAQDRFINKHTDLGFKDKSAVVRQALDYLMERIEEERMRQGVDLYAAMYEQDEELQDLTSASMEDWKNDRTGTGDDNPG